MKPPIQFTTCIQFPHTPAKLVWQKANRIRRENRLPTIEQSIVNAFMQADALEEKQAVVSIDMGGENYFVQITKLKK